MTPSAPLSFRIWIYERIAVPQCSSQIMGMLRPNSSGGPWRAALGKLLGRCQIFLVMHSSMESISAMAERDMTIRQWMGFIFECTPYSKRRCLMSKGSGALLTALQMSSSGCMVPRMCASGQRDGRT